MKINKKIYAMIFARGGSKGIKNKNIKKINGKPLIYYTIDLAKKIKKIKKIFVSTDSKRIAITSKKYGAIIPFKRPKKLSQDKSDEWLAWKHLCDFLKKLNDLPDILISLPATSPLRKRIDIENALKKFIKNKKSDILITARESIRNPYFNMIKLKPNGFAEIVIDKNIKNRQQAPVVLDVTTLAYVTTPDYILRNKNMFAGNVDVLKVPKERSLDIDDKFDLKIAKILMKKK
jgi:CMP-N-acetylneuraminic acid synthetase